MPNARTDPAHAPAGVLRRFVICHHPSDLQWGLYLRQELAALGLDARLQSVDIQPGDNTIQVLHRWLEDRHEVLVVISATGAAGAQDDVWTAAVASRSKVVPVCTDETLPPGALAALRPLVLHGLDGPGIQQLLKSTFGTPVPLAPVPLPTRGAGSGLNLERPRPLRGLLDAVWPALHLWLTRRGFLQAPAEMAVLHDYLGTLRTQLQQELHERSYVPQDAGTVPAPSSMPGRNEDPFVRPVQQLIRQVMGSARGGDGASAQLSASSHKSQVVRDIAHAVLASDEPIVLLGDPGSGKTMTLQNAVLAVVEQQLRRVYPIVPVFVRLGDFHVLLPRRPDIAAVRQFVLENAHPAVAARWEALHAQGRVMVFFDGMDEMSRERYGAHIEALSLFAGAGAGTGGAGGVMGTGATMRTLYSCRINDFSPEFRHRRMVLLPFERPQIAEFLSLYIPKAEWPVRVAGVAHTPKALTARLLSGDTQVDARNPFVLWLLLFYIRARGTWPDSRPALLAFFARRSHLRKRQDEVVRQATAALHGRPFRALSALAFTLMQRNLGTSADQRELARALPGIDIDALVQFGQRCGLLSLSTGPGLPQVRFSHHRLAEFFAARHISRSEVEIDWLSLMDAPRWQETLVNVTLMDGRDEPVTELAAAIRGECETLETEAEAALNAALESTLDTSPAVTRAGAALTADTEIALADRVDLLSRLLRQRALPRPDLMQALERGISTLARHGNPSTQVKMLWAWKNVPAAQVGRSMVKLLSSPVGWVRNQMLMLVADSAEHRRQLGTDLAMQVGLDVARGELLPRLGSHARAASGGRDGQAWPALTLGLAVTAIWMAGLLSGSAWLFSIVRDLKPLSGAPWLNDWVVGAALLGAGLLAQIVKPGLTWAAIGGTAWLLGQVSLGWERLTGATSTGQLIFPALFFTFSTVMAHFIVALASWAWQCGLLMLMTLPAPAGTRIARYRLLLRATWEGAHYRTAFSALPVWLLLCMLAGLLPVAVRRMTDFDVMAWMITKGLGTLSVLVGTLSDWSHLPFSAPVNAGLTASLLLIGITACLAMTPLTAATTGMVILLVLLAAYSLLAWLVLGPVGRLVVELDGWLGAWGVKAILAFLLLLAAGLLLWLSWYAAMTLSLRVAALRRPYPPHSLTPQRWRELLSSTSIRAQALVLERSSHQALGLDPRAYLQELREAEDLIKADPAQGTYWRQRHELEQMLRQEQQGKIGTA